MGPQLLHRLRGIAQVTLGDGLVFAVKGWVWAREALCMCWFGRSWRK